MSLTPFPLPPPDFNSRKLPRFTLETQGFWYRLNRVHYNSSLHFDRSGNGRFDGPNQSYGILYIGDVYSSFIESFGREFEGTVTVKALRNMSLFKITCDRPLSLADATGPGLAIMGMDGRISTEDYEPCRVWGEAIWQHSDSVDGIRYCSRHDNSVYCIGLFDRIQGYLGEENLGNLFDNHPSLLATILERYHYDLIYDD